MGRRIVYIYHSLAVKGGLERVLADKMNYLVGKMGYEIYLVTTDQQGEPFAYALNPAIHHVDLGGLLYHDRYHYRYPMRLWHIWKFGRDFKKRLGRVCDAVNPDIVVATTSFEPSAIVEVTGRWKHVLESHMAYVFFRKAGLHHDMSRVEYCLKSLWDKWVLRKIARYDRIVALTQQDCDGWQQHASSVTIPNPLTYFPPSVAPSDSHTIIAVGRLDGQKGFDLLIRAWGMIAGRHPDWHLDIYGNGHERDNLQQLIVQCGVDGSLHLLPATNEIYNRYVDSAFLVMSSRCEGFGLVLVEAMSCGRPCVAFDCPSGPSDIIIDGKNGLLVKYLDVEELAAKMEWMMAHPAERLLMGQWARESSRRYSQESIMEKWDTLFTSL